MNLVWGFCVILMVLHPVPLGAEEGVHYQANIEGVAEKELRRKLEAVSSTFSLLDKPPVSVGLLRRRAEGDLPRIRKALVSEGYYGADVSVEIDPDAEPVHVKFLVTLGTPYRLESWEVVFTSAAESLKPSVPVAAELGLLLGQPARSADMVKAGEALLRWCRNQGFPFARMAQQRVVVDHEVRSVSITYTIAAGQAARFGSTSIVGLETVDESFVRGKIPWKEGDRFSAELLDQLQRRLLATGLFASVRVAHGEVLINDHLPLTVVVTERKHRTVKAGVWYRTDEGPGVRVSWEHRNLLGRGERLSLLGTASEISLATEGSFRKLDFLRLDQALIFHVRAAEDSPDAYTSLSLNTILQVERLLAPGVLASAGVAFKASEVEERETDTKDSFGLLSLPVQLRWDTSDSLLDPTRGGRLVWQIAPFYNTFGMDVGFVKGSVRYSRYVSVWDKPRVVLAGRGALGAMAGAARDDIPADERFYAGGGDSIRGFPYQAVGPRKGDDPIGGRSLLELSLELRLKVTDTLGLVAFVDGGSAFRSVFPDMGEKLGWGTGMGVRYFSPVGPLRLDVGVPLSRRDDIREDFQIYVSIGQAF